MSFTGYRIYRGLGGIADVDFSTPVQSVAAPASSAELVGAGHLANARYTYVVRPVRGDLESPDVSCVVQFETGPAGEWPGARPAPVEALEAETLADAKIRLRWTYRRRAGWPAVADFCLYHAARPRIATGSPQATVDYTADGAYRATLELAAAQTYWLAVTARTPGGVESRVGVAVGPCGADGAAPPQPAVYADTTF